MNLYLPPDYRPMLPTEGMEDAIKLLKQTFQAELAEALSLWERWQQHTAD